MIPEYEAILEKSRQRHTEVKRQLTWLSKFYHKNFDQTVWT